MGKSIFTLFQSDGDIGVRREADEMMPGVDCTSLEWGGSCDLGWLQLLRCRFSNIMHQKNEVS